MKNKFAFTLGEMLIAFTILGFLSLIVQSTVHSLQSTNDRLSMKKASQVIHDVVDSMVNDGSAYIGQSDFSDLSASRIEIESQRDASLMTYKVEGENKFPMVFYSKLKLLQNPFDNTSEIKPIKCTILVSNTAVEDDANCYESVDGLLWSIPPTDFKDVNVFNIERGGYTTPYVPVTVYVNHAKYKNKPDFGTNLDYFDKFAITFAVRQDGDIRIVSREDCEEESNKKLYQCLIKEVVSDTSL